MPRRSELTHAQVLAASKLDFRQAKAAFHIGHARWKEIREAGGFEDRTRTDADPGRTDELEEKLVESVREKPHLNTSQRAKEVGCSPTSAQKVLTARQLNRLNARLQFAGYRVEVVRPLVVARQRRIVATYPGSLTHVDYKTFGYLRPPRGEAKQPGKRIGGYVVIDSLTAFAHLQMSSVEDAEHAAGALETYCARCPFTPRGILLSDNAKSFLSETFIKTCRSLEFVQRTIKTAHPWSNGKCEALNRTLKYQCFPAIAGNITGWEVMCQLVDVWMDFYNKTRAHTGHVNRGLPPLAFLQLYNSTPGDHLDKLLALGIVEESDKWHLRLMGSADKRRLGDPLPAEGEGSHNDTELPYALVMEKVHDGTYQNVFADHTHQVTDAPPPLAEASRVTLQK